LIETLKHIDETLLLSLNSWHTSIADSIMWTVSGKWIWIPFYAVILWLIFREKRHSWQWYLLGIAVTILLTDQISVHCFKNIFLRYRPSHNLILQHQLHILHNYRGGLYGFVSSHAANTMGLAVFSLLTIKKRWFSILIISWVLLVSYSRVYLGVHYPSDILGGWLVGSGIALLVFKLLHSFTALKS
jgi:undecaprenyl-diphosphatase